MQYSKKVLIKASGLLLAWVAASETLTPISKASAVLLAQSPAPTSFPLPSSVPSGATVKVDGSTSMAVINEALKQRFEEQFSGTTVELAANSTDAALEAVLNGDLDLAAVGRPLTDEEKAQGLVEVPISREKVAIIVGPDNPFNGDIRFEQFARIFRGEITDWSELGGAPGPIRFVDRPDYSDTRQSLGRYSVFENIPFETGSNAMQVAEDQTTAVIEELGNDGIGYAIASQVLGRNDIKIVSMHQTLPDDPRYPYSQPRGYVYKQAVNGALSPALLAFLGFATSASGQEIIQAARATEAEAGAIAGTSASGAAETSPEIAASPEAVISSETETSPAAAAATAESPETALAPAATGATDATAADRGGFPWWLLLIPLLGGLFWWLLKGRKPEEGVAPISTAQIPVATGAVPSPNAVEANAAPPVPKPAIKSGVPTAGLAAGAAGLAATGAAVAAARAYNSRMALVPRSANQAYAYWEVSDEHKATLRQQGGEKMMVRLYDVTGIEVDEQIPHSVKQFDCHGSEPDLHLPIATPDRDYVAEVGYVTGEGRWLKLARSNTMSVPAIPTETIAVAGTAAAVGAVAIGTAAVAERITAPLPTETATEIQSPETVIGELPLVAPVPSVASGCTIAHLRVHSKHNCFLLDAQEMQRLQDTAVSYTLTPGNYVMRLKQGGFHYESTGYTGEPLVLLWIYGGTVINKKTNIPVQATWSSLQGFAKTLTLEVLEPATLCAFFFDTYLEDNAGEVTVSVVRF